MSRAESDAVLKKLLNFLQSDRRIRLGIAFTMVAVLIGYAAYSVYNLIPRTYEMSITGGDILNNRHYLAKILQNEAKKKGITLTIRPVRSTMAALDEVSQGKLDLAFIPGGLASTYPNVEHVATVMPELVHLLAKPGIKGMADLKGKTLNLGTRPSAAREIGLVLARFAGHTANVDYVETNFSPEQLLAMPASKLPDALIMISSVPSFLAEMLVERYGYKVLEIPFPESLALRHGWAGNGQILPYTYDLDPPVPEKTVMTVAVNMHLVGNPKLDPMAVSKLLEVLYSPSVANVLRMPIDEKRISIPSGYPLSPGMTAYLKRNDSVATMENWNKASSLFGVLMSFSGMGIVLVKWFKGAEPKPVTHDKEFQGYVGALAAFEKEMAATEAKAPADLDDDAKARVRAIRDEIHALRVKLLERYPEAKFGDPLLFDRTVGIARAAHEHARDLAKKVAS